LYFYILNSAKIDNIFW